MGAGTALATGLLLRVELFSRDAEAASEQPHQSSPRSPAAFLRIDTDDIITFTTPAVEMGQGGHTAMAMLIMEELGGDWDCLRVADAGAAAIYNNPVTGMQATGGSTAVREWHLELRRIGAAAREMLIKAAAERWNVVVSECTVANGMVLHRLSGRALSFGRVAAHASRLPVPQEPTLKKQDEFTIIGTSPPRVDLSQKVNGSARYGIDVVLPGLMYAAVKCSPTLGGVLKYVDDAAARKSPGYHATVPLHDGVVIVASSHWQAKKALDKVKAEYDIGPLGVLDSGTVTQKLLQGFQEPGPVARKVGDVATALATSSTVVEAIYDALYLAHACMEPMNWTARVSPTGCEVWCGTQTPQAAQAAAAQVLNMTPDRVKVHTMYLGGGFGRRGEADFVAQAVTAAQATGRPVKLIWSREEDIQHDFYRPARRRPFSRRPEYAR